MQVACAQLVINRQGNPRSGAIPLHLLPSSGFMVGDGIAISRGVATPSKISEVDWLDALSGSNLSSMALMASVGDRY
jgi:hypothetical protein